MALIANCNQPFSDLLSVNRVSPPIAQRFPVPGEVKAFCVEPEGLDLVLSGGISYTVTGAVVNPESNYLEPITGQIWPR